MSPAAMPPQFSAHLLTVVQKYRYSAVSHSAIIQHLTFAYNAGGAIARFPFHYHYLIQSSDIVPYMTTADRICEIIVSRLTHFEEQRNNLVRLQKMIIDWYRKTLRTDKIIARNVRDGLPDKIVSITYHPIRDAYFAAAFSGRFPADMENDAYIVRVNRLQTSQEAIEIYCASRRNGSHLIHEYLTEASFKDQEHFEKVFRELSVLGDIFLDEVFTGKVESFLMDYMNKTLYKLNGTNSRTRLQMFLTRNRVVAQYIWKANFSTRKKRGILGAALRISNRNMAGFQSAETLEDLSMFLDRKLEKGKTALDDLPPKIWAKIEQAQEAHRLAKQGVRVGLYGRYFSSDEIERTRVLLAQAWSEADKWLGQKSRMQHAS